VAEALKVKRRYVVYPGDERYSMGGDVTATPVGDLADELST
jgi:hypothetical protein